MSLQMPVLDTERLLVRPFQMTDLEAVYQLFDRDLFPPAGTDNEARARQARVEWLQWTILGYEQRALLAQPPYGDRAIIRKEDKQLVGAVGYVPCLNAFGQLPFFQSGLQPERGYTAELGLYYAVASESQGKGYATEAAQAMIDYAFEQLKLKRIVATTTYDNVASQAVMRKLGMRVETNPTENPPWLQVVGILSGSK